MLHVVGFNRGLQQICDSWRQIIPVVDLKKGVQLRQGFRLTLVGICDHHEAKNRIIHCKRLLLSIKYFFHHFLTYGATLHHRFQVSNQGNFQQFDVKMADELHHSKFFNTSSIGKVSLKDAQCPFHTSRVAPKGKILLLPILKVFDVAKTPILKLERSIKLFDSIDIF